MFSRDGGERRSRVRGCSLSLPAIESQNAFGKAALKTYSQRLANGVSEPREASGVRPIYRRFPSGAGQPAVHGRNARFRNRPEGLIPNPNDETGGNPARTFDIRASGFVGVS